VLLQVGQVRSRPVYGPIKLPLAPLSNEKKLGPGSTKGLSRVCGHILTIGVESTSFFRALYPYAGNT